MIAKILGRDNFDRTYGAVSTFAATPFQISRSRAVKGNELVSKEQYVLHIGR
jgi:hypothetical protein